MIAELTARAFKYNSSIVATGCTICSETNPAPLVAALLASYVVTAFVFKCGNPAFRTRLHVVVSGKVIELSVANISTTNTAMGSCTTTHAHLLAARAGSLAIEPAAPSNVIEAAVPGTPAQVGVHVDVDVHLEAQVLFENVFGPEGFDVVFGELHLAAVLHARDLDNLAIDDVRF